MNKLNSCSSTEKQFWYTIDRDAKCLSNDKEMGMFGDDFENFFQWISALVNKIMKFIQSDKTDHCLVLQANEINKTIDFYRLSDNDRGNLHTMARIYYFSKKSDIFIDNAIKESIKLLREKQPFRSWMETCMIFGSTIDEMCAISFIKIESAIKNDYSLYGPMDLLPSPKRYPSKGLLSLITWILQLYTSSMGRIKIVIPLKISTSPKSFLGANQNAVYYRLIDNSVVKVFNNYKLCQHELIFLSMLDQMFEIISTSLEAFQFRPLAKKIKCVNWSQAMDFLLCLFYIHDKGIIHHNISADSMMWTKDVSTLSNGLTFPIFVNFEYAVKVGDESTHQNCNKQIVSDRILQMRLNGRISYFPHFNDDLQAFVRTLLILMEQLPLPSKTDPQTMIDFWRRVLSRRSFWSNLDAAASFGNRQTMIDLMSQMKNLESI